MDDRIIKILLEIKNTHGYGDEIFENKKRLDNILKDLLIGDIKYNDCIGRINALMYAIDEQMHEKLTQYQNDLSKTQKYYVDLLKRKYSLNDEAALFAVNATSAVVGVKALSLETRAEKVKQPRVKQPKTKQAKPKPSKTKQMKPKQRTPKKTVAKQKMSKKAASFIALTSVALVAFIIYLVIPSSPDGVQPEPTPHQPELPVLAQADFPVSDFTYDINDDGTVIITGYDGQGGHIEIPAVIDGISVTSIANAAFFGRTDLISVTILDGVTHIGDFAFAGCINLTNVVIPYSITYIGDFAFWQCSSLSNEVRERILQVNPNVQYINR